jgi:hypothetical protein
MSPSAQLTLEKLREIIKDEKKTAKGAREVQVHVDSKEDLDPDNTSSVLNTVLNTINKEFDHECFDKAVRLLNAHLIHQSTDDRIAGHKHSIPGLPGTKTLAQQVWARRRIMTGCVWVADIPGALVADEMSFGKTFTSVAAAMVSKLHTEIVVMGLPLSILWKNTLNEWVNLVQIDFPRNLGDEQEWYPLRR